MVVRAQRPAMGPSLQGVPSGRLSPWPLPHLCKTKLSFFARNVRSHSISVCIHDQQGAVPSQSVRPVTTSPTPTPTPTSLESNQKGRPLFLPSRIGWV